MANKTDQVKKLIYVGMILIFIAHATITDVQSKATSKMTLEETFKSELPKMALKQIADYISLVIDRILEAPSIW